MFIEIEIATDNTELLNNEPDWANLGIDPPEGSSGFSEIDWKTIFINPSNIEYFEGIFVCTGSIQIVNIRLVSGKMISAKNNDVLGTYIKQKISKKEDFNNSDKE